MADLSEFLGADPMVLRRLPPGPRGGRSQHDVVGQGLGALLRGDRHRRRGPPAGRSLARAGRLSAPVVLAGMSSAVVDPGDESPMVAQIRVESLPPSAWDGFVTEAARESGYAADLEAGVLPEELVEHCDELGVEILPGPGDIETACECDAWAQPCVHVLALLYQLAWHIDRDPYVLLLLRGRTRERLLADIDDRLSGRAHGEVEDAARRAALILDLASDAPTGHGLADAEVAAYDEAISRLL